MNTGKDKDHVTRFGGDRKRTLNRNQRIDQRDDEDENDEEGGSSEKRRIVEITRIFLDLD